MCLKKTGSKDALFKNSDDVIVTYQMSKFVVDIIRYDTSYVVPAHFLGSWMKMISLKL